MPTERMRMETRTKPLEGLVRVQFLAPVEMVRAVRNRAMRERVSESSVWRQMALRADDVDGARRETGNER